MDVDEYYDIFDTRTIRPRTDGKSFQAKEFGNSLEETLEFANQPINVDKVAIIKVTIPENVYIQIRYAGG